MEDLGEALVIVRTGCGAGTKLAKEWLGLASYCVCAFPSAQEGGMCLVMGTAV